MTSESELRSLFAAVKALREQERKKEIEANQKWCLEWAKQDPKVDCTKTLLSETLTVSAAVAMTSVDTNNQHEGLDEGGIVKRAGDVIVVLRRGRLFTIDVEGDRLSALDVADLAPPASKKEEDDGWYDELLIADRTVVVIGYSYLRDATEIVLFDLRERGRLEYRATYHLRSDDYYSGSNYASRLVGSRLLLYTQFELPEDLGKADWLPAFRKWRPGEAQNDFQPIAGLDSVFVPATPLSADVTVHTFIACDLAVVQMSCDGRVVLGDSLHTYYASPSAAYAWTTRWSDQQPSSILYRVPFDGSPITALQVSGTPTDQLSFFESDGHLNVLLSHPEGMTSMLRMPVDQFADGSTAAAPSQYQVIDGNKAGWFVNRFVGDYAVVTSGDCFEDRHDGCRLVLVGWRTGQTSAVKLTHPVSRIESLGGDAIAIGSNERTVGMTTLRLRSQPALVRTLEFPDASVSETRSHAFLYGRQSESTGMFGLPVAKAAAVNGMSDEAMLFVRNRDLDLGIAGVLDARVSDETDDGCLVSCADWYGDAQPLFLGRRIFALVGYELIEGELDHNGHVSEVRRLNFTPKSPGQ